MGFQTGSQKILFKISYPNIFMLLLLRNWENLQDHSMLNTRNIAENSFLCCFSPLLLFLSKKPTNRTNQIYKIKEVIFQNSVLQTSAFKQTHFLMYVKGLFWACLLTEVLNTNWDSWNWNFPSDCSAIICNHLDSHVCSM